jgi:hypothetical protein
LRPYAAIVPTPRPIMPTRIAFVSASLMSIARPMPDVPV